jgi:hypothetical protein
MCCCLQCSLHHICANLVNNDNVHQSSEAVSDDKDIHSLSGVVKEKVGYFLLNICSTLQSNSCDNNPKSVVGYYTFTLARSLKQMGT